jgi:hypothetical protein
MAAGWGLRFQPSPDAVAWRRGAAGERRTAQLLGPLERHGWAILHDLAVPRSQANLDHLLIGPGGVFVIDSKHYRGRLQLDPTGRLWHGRYPLVWGWWLAFGAEPLGTMAASGHREAGGAGSIGGPVVLPASHMTGLGSFSRLAATATREPRARAPLSVLHGLSSVGVVGGRRGR